MEFKVKGMSCNHCVQAVTKAVEQVAPGSRTDIDLKKGIVAVEAEESFRGVIRDAIEDAGFKVLR